MNSTIDYLDQLYLDYTQLCQRKDGSIYGIASGKMCIKGSPISYNPTNLEHNKALLKQKIKRVKAIVRSLVSKAKSSMTKGSGTKKEITPTKKSDRTKKEITSTKKSGETEKPKPPSQDDSGKKPNKPSTKRTVSQVVSRAKEGGLSNKDIQSIKEEVKTELNATKVQGKKALDLFEKKINDRLSKKGVDSSSKPKPPTSASKKNTKTATSIVERAKEQGLSNKEIQKVKEEVKAELNTTRVQGKDAINLFEKKINERLNKGATSKPGGEEPQKVENKKLVKANSKDHRDYIDAAYQNHKEALSRVDKARQEYEAALGKGRGNLAYVKNVQEKLEVLKKEMSNLRSEIMGKGDKAKAEAETEEVLRNSKSRSLPENKAFYREALAKVMQFTNNSTKTLEKLIFDDERGYAIKPWRGEGGLINVGRHPKKSESETVLWHEYGHHVEYGNPNLFAASMNWVMSRSTGKVKSLRNLTGNKNYGRNELAYEGNYGLGPYVGYKNTSGSEVISMGLQQFTNPAQMAEFARKDFEHFVFIIGVLDSL